MTDKSTCSAGHERCPRQRSDGMLRKWACPNINHPQKEHATCGTPIGEECREAPKSLDVTEVVEELTGEPALPFGEQPYEDNRASGEGKVLRTEISFSDLLESYARRVERQEKRSGPLPNCDSGLAPALRNAAATIRDKEGFYADLRVIDAAAYREKINYQKERAALAEVRGEELEQTVEWYRRKARVALSPKPEAKENQDEPT